MPPFWTSIALLSLAQGAVVAAPGTLSAPWLARLSGRRWAVIPPASVIAFVFIARAAERASAQSLTYLALCAVPAARGARPGLAGPRRAPRVGAARAAAVRARLGGPRRARGRGGRAHPLGAQLRVARRADRRRHAAALAGRGHRRDGRRGHGARGLRPLAASQQRAQRRPPRGGPAAAAERRVRLGGDGLRRSVRRGRARGPARGDGGPAPAARGPRCSPRSWRWPSTCCSSSSTSCRRPCPWRSRC